MNNPSGGSKTNDDGDTGSGTFTVVYSKENPAQHLLTKTYKLGQFAHVPRIGDAVTIGQAHYRVYNVDALVSASNDSGCYVFVRDKFPSEGL